MKRTLLNLTFAGFGAALALVAAQFLPSYGKDGKDDRTPPKITVDNSALERGGGQFTTSFAPIIKKAAPSVVTIFASHMVKNPGRANPLFDNPLFREFFDEQGRRPSRPQKEEALGSGVIVSDDGYILTSNHIVEGADDIKIELPDGKDYTAKVIGTDPATDTAVLKIEATGLPAITLANSDALEVGDVVLAIGNPFGLGQTVTMGIVSATGRGDLNITAYEDFIQTDASINMGNSGGALVDAGGRLVGINTAILSRTGGNQGVGFAIPINMGRLVMEGLIQNGRVSRGYLGVGLQALTPELAERLEIKEQGALINGVLEGTPAAEAGLKPGDLITEFNGKKVAGERQLRLMVSQTAPKTKVSFKVLRDGKSKSVQTTLGELPTERTLSGMLHRTEPQPKAKETLEGVEVSDLDAKARRQFGIPSNLHGALVTAVDPSSSAAEAGLHPGDLILEIEKKTVANADDAIEFSNDFKGKTILLYVWSHGRTSYVPVPVGMETKENQDSDDPPKRGKKGKSKRDTQEDEK